MENYMKLELAAFSENEGFARNAVAAFALCLNPSLSELSDIKTAVSEAVTNCIVHAYGGEAKGSVWIECRVETTSHFGALHHFVRGGRGTVADHQLFHGSPIYIRIAVTQHIGAVGAHKV